MKIQQCNSLSMNNGPSFKGKVTKNVENFIKYQAKKEVDVLVSRANYKETIIDLDAVKLIKDKWNVVLENLKESMSKTHKDSRLNVYPDSYWGPGGYAVQYSNSRLPYGSIHRTPTRDLERVLDILKEMATPDSDSALLNKSVRNLEEGAILRTTKLNQFITKHRAKKAEKFAREINSDKLNIVENIKQRIDEVNKKQALEKQNKQLAENALEIKRNGWCITI